MAQPTNRPQLAPSSSDVPSSKGNYASSLQGGLPMRKRRTSPFDRIGARQFQNQKGKTPTSYA